MMRKKIITPSINQKYLITFLCTFLFFSYKSFSQNTPADYPTKEVVVKNGRLKGRVLPSGIEVFKGIPYAAPPIGNLRWKAPQPLANWEGVKDAGAFGAHPIQTSSFLYEFRSKEMNEDCLYLNIWSKPANKAQLRPIYVFIYGGSFIHGDGSQPAYDGESMAKKGIVYVTLNYRLGVFGFLAHPELGKESPLGASGNYGLLDQLEAIKWIKNNIKTFGGDPDKITIGGESVGAQSVSAHMSSPLSKGLFTGAIAQSGSLLDYRPLITTRLEAEKLGLELSEQTKSKNISELRKIPAEKLLKIVGKENPRRFKPNVDGYFLPKSPLEVFSEGKQANVPLLVGWNAQEVPSLVMFRLRKATPKNLKKAVKKMYGDDAEDILKFYSVKTNADAKKAASEIMSDRLINYSAWQLAELHSANQSASVYRYLFDQPHPGLTKAELKKGPFFQKLKKRLLNKVITGSAFHASEIEYALGNLNIQDNYNWQKEDYLVSNQMQNYFSNFIKNGNPNIGESKSLIEWPVFSQKNKEKFIRIGTNSQIESENSREKYLFLKGLGVVK